MGNPLLIVWALGLLAVVVNVVEQNRGTAGAPQDEKLKLRTLWRGWPTGAYARLAFHEASEPTRSRLRRSAWASVVFLLCWTIGAANMGGPILALLAIPGPLLAGFLVWSLLRRQPTG